MRRVLLVISLFSILYLVGCASSKEIGNETIIQESGDKPEWISTPTSSNENFIFVTGELTKAKDRSFGMNQAYADGVRKLMNTMQNDVKTQSSLALRGNNVDEDDVGRFSEFAVAWISDTYKVAGVKNPKTYWEKVEVKTPTGVKYFYNCYSLLQISKKDYNRALEGAYYNMQNKAREANNKKAEQTAIKLIDELKAK